MNRQVLLGFLGVLAMAMAKPSLAADLLTIYRQAFESDPTFQAADATRRANQEALPQSRSQILPNLSATANTTFNRENSDSLSALQHGSRINKYNSNGYTVSLSQPIFNFGSWMKIRQASAQVKQADANYAAAAQDLMIRVADAYFNVLLAEDKLRYTLAQKDATAHQLDQTKQRFKVGLDTITSVNEAQASYDSIVAQEISARNDIVNNKEKLRQITGIPYDAINSLSVDLPLVVPEPANVESWVSAASEQNYQLQAARYAVTAARENIKTNYAGHLPTVAAVGNYQFSNGLVDGVAQKGNSQSTSIALQLNVPIYQGGLVSSQTRQAQAEYAKTSADMEAAYRDTVTKTRQAYNDIVSGISKIKADKQTIVSSESALETTEEAFKVGTRTIIDVLNSQKDLYQAQFNYAQDQYRYIMSTLSLKQQAGTLSAADITLVNSWLQPVSNATSPELKEEKKPVSKVAVKKTRKTSKHHKAKA